MLVIVGAIMVKIERKRDRKKLVNKFSTITRQIS